MLSINSIAIRRICIQLLLLALPLTSFSQTTLIPFNSSWKYKDDGVDQGTGWRASGYDDSGWASGNGQLGFGYPGITTTLNSCANPPTCNQRHITNYFRRKITIPDVTSFTNFLFDMFRDDGVVIYVNGTEVYRNGLGGTVIYTTLASPNISNNADAVHSTTLSAAASLFVTGENTIAVEVHQSSLTSSNILWDLKLVGLPVTPVTRGPYLQKATPNSIVVRWRTGDAVDSKVTYGITPGNLNQSVVVSGTRTEHTVQLSGLMPYTQYYYSVGTSTSVIQSGVNFYFLTSPGTGATGKYKFWVLGDAGSLFSTQYNVRDWYYTHIGSGITNGWLLLGDNAYNDGTDAEYGSKFFNIYQDKILKNSPLWPIPGNHEYYEGNQNLNRQTLNIAYYNIFDLPINGEAGGVPSGNEAFYSFNYGNIHFVGLDSWCTGPSGKLRLDDPLSDQVAWLKLDLAANTQPWTVVFFHHPPYSKGSHDSDTEFTMKEIHEKINPIIESYGVDLVLSGHSHIYERSKLLKGHFGDAASFNPATHNLSSSSGKYNGTSNSCPYIKSTANKNGTVYVVAGSAGKLDNSGEVSQCCFPHNAMPYSTFAFGGSLILEVEDNRLDGKFLSETGLIWDQFTIMKNVNKTTNLPNINQGESFTIGASWVGNYSWPHSSETTRNSTITPPATGSYTYYVNDPQTCLRDAFSVNVLPPLPVELISFKAEVETDRVTLLWKTASELNNDFFEVQRFTNQEEIQVLGNVKGHGTTRESNSYKFVDFAPLKGRAYYRLKQIDYDGSYQYSNIITASFEGGAGMKIFPNPGDGTELNLATGGYPGPFRILLFDALGVQLATYHANTQSEASTHTIRMDTPLAAGMYFVRIENSLVFTTHKWIVK